MAPKPDMSFDRDRKVSAEDVVEEAAFYRRLFESNDPTTAMLRDSLSRSTDANHLQHLIRLHSSGSQDSQTVTSQIFAQGDLPSLMQRSVGTERATELAAMGTYPKDFTIARRNTAVTTQIIDHSKNPGSSFLGVAKGVAKPSFLETKKGGGDAQFVRDFMKQAKDTPAGFSTNGRKNDGKPGPPSVKILAQDPTATLPSPMAGFDTEDKELFRRFMLSSIGMRSVGTNNNNPTDFSNLLPGSVGGDNELLKFFKTLDARPPDDNGDSPFMKFMKSMSLMNASQNSNDRSTDFATRNASIAYMDNMLKSTDFSTDLLKMLESSKTLSGISPQNSVFLNSTQEFLPRGVSLEMEQRFRSALLNSQTNHMNAWDLSARQLPMQRALPVNGASTVSPIPVAQVPLRPNWQALDNTRLAQNPMLTRPPAYSGGDNSAAEAAMALASMQPREEEMLRRQSLGDDKPKRKRQRKVHEPAQKVFVEVNSQDVLFGRGGRTNHHPGNKTYLELKEMLQERYREADKNEKTLISQELVDLVHQRGGRFLKLENGTEDSWYEVLNITARKKASQTLREINTPDERAKKRARYAK
ncbi:hypothetical protein FisN_1Hh356 [Fistulifera solaris]|uniref:DUF6824 domain-containing protein n=1 Tax=Fistulifera solaris TaxID=1519565 RepID=A0A1Z5J9Y9_FISSO|nr:hypothetical protein FisN_1Hh356 [Fistulifera solaris]|eukprot:GAX10814.1 hypothetical protein FisN_1Hh356 [Fistulifera solaris]